jgi:hypothetical protein
MTESQRLTRQQLDDEMAGQVREASDELQRVISGLQQKIAHLQGHAS